MDATELREDVALAIAQMRDKRELRREIPELSSRATSHEHVLAAARARTADAYVGVLAVTDRRVLFVSHGPFRKKFEDFDMETVDNVSWAEGVLGGSLLLGVKGREVPYSGLDKKDGRRLSDAVRKQIST